MSKINEIIESGLEFYDRNLIQTKSVENMMKEYAEWYLEQFKESCKDYSYTDDYGQTLITETQFNQIPNPPHE
jgi:DNA repair photolyase